MSDVSVAPDVAARPFDAAADQDDRAESSKRAPGERGAAIGRAYGTGSGLLARAVRLVLSGVVLIIVAGILLTWLKANPGNGVVSEVHGWGSWLVGPFRGMFSFHRARVALAVNWGLAAVVYVFVGGLISRLVGGSHNWRLSAKRSSIPNQEA